MECNLESLEARRMFSGALDPTFANQGVLIRSGSGVDTATESIAVARDGSMYALCYSIQGYSMEKSLDIEINLMHVFPNGAIDYSFGQRGIAVIGKENWADFEDMVVQIDARGRPVVAFEPPDLKSIALVRLLPDGTIDTTFGRRGRTDYPMPDYPVIGSLAHDSKGNWWLAASSADHTRIAQFAPDGKLEKTIYPTPQSGLPFVAGIAIDSHDRIIATGWMDGPLTGSIFTTTRVATATRILSNGKIDRTFGSNGWAIDSFGKMDSAFSNPVIDHRGRIVVHIDRTALAYDPYFTTSEHGVVRLNANGSLDTNFAQNGVFVLTGGNGISGGDTPMVVQPDDKIVVENDYSQLYRLTATGVLDSTFNQTGYTNAGFDRTSVLNAYVFSNGHIVFGSKLIGADIDYDCEGFWTLAAIDAGPMDFSRDPAPAPARVSSLAQRFDDDDLLAF